MTAETDDQASGDLNLVKALAVVIPSRADGEEPPKRSSNERRMRGPSPSARLRDDTQERAWCDVLSEVSSDVIYQILLRRLRCCGRCRTIPNNFSFLHHK